jgi:hypothetical protein
MFNEILTESELITLTEKIRPAAQARALDYLGIKYMQRPSGTLIVYGRDALKLPVSQMAFHKERHLSPDVMARINGQTS